MPLFGNDEEEETTTTTTEETQVSEEVTVEPNLPDIELIIEDGTGVSGANSYCDLDFALKYCVEKGYSSWIELSEAEQKSYILRGTDFVDNFYEWKGYTRRGQYQSLSFPRDRVYDDRGFEIDGIPEKLKKACVEAAYLNSTSGSDSLFGTTDANGKIKRQKVDTLEVEYYEGTKVASDSTLVNYTSIYDILNKLLKGLYKTKSDSNITCARARWIG